jgi:hypothetical protein
VTDNRIRWASERHVKFIEPRGSLFQGLDKQLQNDLGSPFDQTELKTDEEIRNIYKYYARIKSRSSEPSMSKETDSTHPTDKTVMSTPTVYKEQSQQSKDHGNITKSVKQFSLKPSTTTAPTFCTIQSKHILPQSRRQEKETLLDTKTESERRLVKPLVLIRHPIKAIKKLAKGIPKERWIVRKTKPK